MNRDISGLRQPRMPPALLKAANDGNRADLIRLLEAGEDVQNPSEGYNTLLQSVTPSGDNLLHILVTKKHNELACIVFNKDRSILKARNKMLETPLHSVAKVGNKEVLVRLVQLAPSEVNDVLRAKDSNGQTALHEAAKNGHEGVVRDLMQLDPVAAYEVNKEGLSPLYNAIEGRYTSLVQTMLGIDATLASTPELTGSYPIHVAASMCDARLVVYFIEEYPDAAKLTDRCGRNLFHIIAQENKKEILTTIFALRLSNILVSEMVAAMIRARDSEGNTPLHIAAMKGHRSIIEAILQNVDRAEEEKRNHKGQTPFDLSVIRVKQTNEDMQDKITEYTDNEGPYFTPKWFDEIIELSALTKQERIQDKLERIQVIGLGSVLITTVAFAVAFTLPGGLNPDNGTPILGGRYIFRAFIIANTLAFLQAFASLFTIISAALIGGEDIDLRFAYFTFLSAASCMVVAFGLGLYVMLAPVRKPLAILVLVLTFLFGSPTAKFILEGAQNFVRRYLQSQLILVMASYGIPLLSIFCLAFL